MEGSERRSTGLIIGRLWETLAQCALGRDHVTFFQPQLGAAGKNLTWHRGDALKYDERGIKC